MLMDGYNLGADDLVLAIWGAIVILGAAQKCQDVVIMTELLLKTERLLNAIMPHLARSVLLDFATS
jgi:hypothetical protein